MQELNVNIPTAPRAWREKRERAERLVASWQEKEKVKEKEEGKEKVKEKPKVMATDIHEPLPSDVAAARKKRINNELIALARRPCPPGKNPVLQGIGLYTHVASTQANTPSDGPESQAPRFLPMSSEKRAGGIKGQIDPAMQKLYQQIREAVNKEEEIVGKKDMTLDEINKRYAALQRCGDERSRTGSQKAGESEEGETRSRQGTDSRRVSLASSGDVVMGGTEEGRRPSLGTATRNTYDPTRDPRARARQL